MLIFFFYWTEVSKAVEEAITSDEFVISMRNIHHLVNRRKKTETLFSLEFPGTHQKFSLQLNRESKQGTFFLSFIVLVQINFRNYL